MICLCILMQNKNGLFQQNIVKNKNYFHNYSQTITIEGIFINSPIGEVVILMGVASYFNKSSTYSWTVMFCKVQPHAPKISFHLYDKFFSMTANIRKNT